MVYLHFYTRKNGLDAVEQKIVLEARWALVIRHPYI